MMIDGAHLAATAKHAPEQLDADDVRCAGFAIERYAALLRCIRVWHVHTADGGATVTLELPSYVAADTMCDWADVIGGA